MDEQQEPVLEEPTLEESTLQEPVLEEPTLEESTLEEPDLEELHEQHEHVVMEQHEQPQQQQPVGPAAPEPEPEDPHVDVPVSDAMAARLRLAAMLHGRPAASSEQDQEPEPTPRGVPPPPGPPPGWGGSSSSGGGAPAANPAEVGYPGAQAPAPNPAPHAGYPGIPPHHPGPGYMAPQPPPPPRPPPQPPLRPQPPLQPQPPQQQAPPPEDLFCMHGIAGSRLNLRRAPFLAQSQYSQYGYNWGVASDRSNVQPPSSWSPWGPGECCYRVSPDDGQRQVYWLVRRGMPQHNPVPSEFAVEQANVDARTVPEQSHAWPICLWAWTLDSASHPALWGCNKMCRGSGMMAVPREPYLFRWIPIHGPWCQTFSEQIDRRTGALRRTCRQVPEGHCSRHPQYNPADPDQYAPARLDSLRWPSVREVMDAMDIWRCLTLNHSMRDVRNNMRGEALNPDRVAALCL